MPSTWASAMLASECTRSMTTVVPVTSVPSRSVFPIALCSNESRWCHHVWLDRRFDCRGCRWSRHLVVLQKTEEGCFGG